MNRKPSANPGRARPMVVLGGLCVVAMATVLRLAGQSPATAAGEPPKQGTPPAGDAGRSGPETRTIPPLVVDWEPVLQRDLFNNSLFAPPQTQPAAEAPVEIKPDMAALYLADARGRFTLQATMAGARPTAIINGTTYGIGDVVSGSYTIKRIEQRRIVLVRNGVEMEMTCE